MLSNGLKSRTQHACLRVAAAFALMAIISAAIEANNSHALTCSNFVPGCWTNIPVPCTAQLACTLVSDPSFPAGVSKLCSDGTTTATNFITGATPTVWPKCQSTTAVGFSNCTDRATNCLVIDLYTGACTDANLCGTTDLPLCQKFRGTGCPP
jgi:hypothetical protein